MTKIDLISLLLQSKLLRLSKIETTLLKIKLLVSIYTELSEIFNNQYKEYSMLIKSHLYGKKSHINLPQEILKDILATKEYSLTGVSIYTCIPEEVLIDIVSGINTAPTFDSSMKLFELHLTVRKALYNKLVEKILSDLVSEQDNKNALDSKKKLAHRENDHD